MKYNLKNRPTRDSWQKDLWCEQYEKWFEGFEKELREILEKEKGMVTLNDDDSTRDVLIGVKEILGE